ncbi:UvrD-helicase domain-containing protein [Alicyclobacillus tolerans]|uniref:RNA polymerase recycling motor HelD n=1 Tax=Alicyclobacillus tolerans TaxID=90970 RepID=UPI001F01486C|nr:RNA polymerase recycling motor HelD [Alicyclobacillus tolerans]MCF8564105.1 UvrD-helicase domain-containing protein [Alicyclobacillus tolerans]
MISEQEQQGEQNYLKRVVSILDHLIDAAKMVVSQRKQGLMEERRYMWENVGHDAASPEISILLAQHASGLAEEELGHNVAEEVVKRYERVASSPYFGRMDFQENGTQIPEAIYIGMTSVQTPSNPLPLVYDWRAPISSMYYDYGLEQAQYESPQGQILGKITRKRQYKIANRQLEAVFDTDVRIGDDVLQQMLSRHADEKMSSIVQSIQREQNQAIRNPRHRVFIVQGPAGSGKTSIALQRVAYLLYKQRRTLTADNIVLFAPNQIFHEYVSNVLPELGESNMWQETFQRYAAKAFRSRFRFEDLYSHLERLLSRDPSSWSIQDQTTRFKFSLEFRTFLREYAASLNRGGIPFQNLTYRGKTVVSAKEMSRLFYGPLARYRLPARMDHLRVHVEKRLSVVENRVRQRIEKRLRADTRYMGTDDEIRAESQKLASQLVGRVRSEFYEMTLRLPFDAYVQAFENKSSFLEKVQPHKNSPLEGSSSKGSFAGNLPNSSLGNSARGSWHDICQNTLKSLTGGQPVPYEDSLAIWYLYAKILGPSFSQSVPEDIRHVLIDEAQDYTLLQLETVKILFPKASFTILGDPSQSIHPYAPPGEFLDSPGVFGVEHSQVAALTKSYRSTQEIFKFAQALLGEEQLAAAVRPSGQKPNLVQTSQENAGRDTILAVRRLRDQGMKSIAVIARTAAEAGQLYASLAHQDGFQLITKNDLRLTESAQTAIIPSYLAKGFEFDAVVVFDASSYFAHERRLLYAVCTRALHHLTLVFTKPLPWLKQLPNSLYTLIAT